MLFVQVFLGEKKSPELKQLWGQLSMPAVWDGSMRTLEAKLYEPGAATNGFKPLDYPKELGK